MLKHMRLPTKKNSKTDILKSIERKKNCDSCSKDQNTLEKCGSMSIAITYKHFFYLGTYCKQSWLKGLRKENN